MFTREKMPHVLAATLTASALLAGYTHAATLYFDGGTTDIAGNGNGASTGGAGTWDTTIKNWDAGAVPYVAWNNANGDNAVIAGIGTLTVDVPVTVGSLTLSYTSGTRAVSGSTITINSGISFGSPAGLTWTAPITLGGSQTWSHGGGNSTAKRVETGGTNLNGHTLTWNSTNTTANSGFSHRTITGNGSIIKDGTGWLTLSSTTAGHENTYTGSTTVNAGTLTMGGTTALGNVNNQLTVNGGTLNMVSYSLSVGNLTGTGGVITSTHTSGTRLLTIGSGDTGGGNFQGVIENGTTGSTTALTKTGNGIITLSGGNTYTGATNVTGGTLVINGDQTLATGLVTVNGGAIGGTGTIGGSLNIAAGSLYVVNLSDPLDVSGTTSIYSGFGVDDLAGITWGSVADGTYTLINGTLGGGVFGSLMNNSAGTAFPLGGGRSAYFKEGSLKLVVVPEPASLALLGLGGLMMLRRRK